MSSMESLLAVSIVFWCSIFLYMVWVDRKLTALQKTVQAMEDKG